MMKEIDIEDKNNWSRPPGDIEFSGMIIAEVFEESKFDDLKEGLEKIYTENNLEYRLDRLEDIFERPSIGSWGNSNVQVTLANENKEDDVHGHRVQFEELGPYVDFVEFSLARVSPSFMVLQIALTFSEDGKDILNDIYSYTHEEFREEVVGAEKIYNPSNLKKEEIELVKERAVKDVLEVVEGYFQGSLSESSEEQEKLVKMPVYVVESLSDYDNSLDDEDDFEDKKEIEKFSVSHGSFLNTLGVTFSDHQVYEHDCYFLSCDRSAGEVFTNFSIFTDDNLKEEMLENKGSHWGVMDYLQMDFKRSVNLMALMRYTENFSNKVDSYSRNLSQYQQENPSIPGLKSYCRFRKIKKLNEDRITDRRNFTRLFRELEGFDPIGSGLKNIKTENSFIEDAKDYIQNLGDRQETLSKNNDKFYQELLDLSKVSANYNLQFWVFFLTVVIVVIEALRVASIISPS